ncbi:MAG: hypothetical protein J6Q41_08605 [Firmicutes bacterium]|nr:hypothetical protein [Bacillota bacterium]
MKETKFSMNALVIVVMIFAAIAFFFTVKMVNLADRFPINEFYRIEDTEYAVRYSSLEPNGIYRGSESASTLVLEGTYGYDWGLVLKDDNLYINEYITTDVGLLMCDLVKIDMNTMEKTVLKKNTILRGSCKSGELVCMGDYIMPANNPKVNSLCKFYAMSTGDLDTRKSSATIMYLDPNTSEVLYSLVEKMPQAPGFEAKYLDRSLDEVKADTAETGKEAA